MKKSRFTESQIVAILKEGESGSLGFRLTQALELCYSRSGVLRLPVVIGRGVDPMLAGQVGTNWAVRDAAVIAALNAALAERARRGFWKCYHRMRNLGHRWNQSTMRSRRR